MKTIIGFILLFALYFWASYAQALDLDDCIDEGDCAVANAPAHFGCIGSDSESCAWDPLDYGLQGGFLSLTIADWSLTATAIAQNRRGWNEANPILGRNPNQLGLSAYMLGWSALHTSVAMVLPRPWRTVWQSATILVGIDTLRVWGGSVYFPW